MFRDLWCTSMGDQPGGGGSNTRLILRPLQAGGSLDCT